MTRSTALPIAPILLLLPVLAAVPPAVAAAGGLDGVLSEGAEPELRDGPAESGVAPEGSRGWVLLPFVFHSPETSWGGGVASVHHFRRESADRPSTVLASVAYTANRQSTLEILPDLYLRGSTLQVEGELTLRDFPDLFYGIGSATPASLEEEFTSRGARGRLALLSRRLDPWSFGPQLALSYLDVRDVTPGGLLAGGDVPGGDGGLAAGMGAVAVRDTRDDVLVPRSGAYGRLEAMAFDGAFGSDFDFQRYRLDLRRFHPVRTRDTLGVQLFAQATRGDAPFDQLAMLGGGGLMRGTYAGRFRDRDLAAFQVEYRLPLRGRWGLVGFAGAGGVAQALSDLRGSDLEPSAGAGLRLRVGREEAIHVRLDAAAGGEDVHVYLSLLEAF